MHREPNNELDYKLPSNKVNELITHASGIYVELWLFPNFQQKSLGDSWNLAFCVLTK